MTEIDFSAPTGSEGMRRDVVVAAHDQGVRNHGSEVNVTVKVSFGAKEGSHGPEIVASGLEHLARLASDGIVDGARVFRFQPDQLLRQLTSSPLEVLTWAA